MARNPNPKLSKAAQNRRKAVDNAKRRYRRQAERYRNDAKSLTGRDAEILEQAATLLDQRAQSLNGVNVRKKLDKEVNDLVKESKNYLVSANRDEWMRGENIGRLRLSGTNDGNTFFALTESLWAGAPYEQRYDYIRRALNRNKEIVKKYGRNVNVNEMIEIVSQATGIDIDSDYELGDSSEIEVMRGIQAIVTNYG